MQVYAGGSWHILRCHLRDGPQGIDAKLLTLSLFLFAADLIVSRLLPASIHCGRLMHYLASTIPDPPQLLTIVTVAYSPTYLASKRINVIPFLFDKDWFTDNNINVMPN